jgi:hypothetical protein
MDTQIRTMFKKVKCSSAKTWNSKYLMLVMLYLTMVILETNSISFWRVKSLYLSQDITINRQSRIKCKILFQQKWIQTNQKKKVVQRQKKVLNLLNHPLRSHHLRSHNLQSHRLPKMRKFPHQSNIMSYLHRSLKQTKMKRKKPLFRSQTLFSQKTSQINQKILMKTTQNKQKIPNSSQKIKK